MRPGVGFAVLSTEVAMAVSAPLAYVASDPGCPPPGLGAACSSPWGLVPAYTGVGLVLAAGPAILVALAIAWPARRIAADRFRGGMLLLALGAAGVLGSDLLLLASFPSWAPRALPVLIVIGLAVSLGLDGAYAFARRIRSRPETRSAG